MNKFSQDLNLEVEKTVKYFLEENLNVIFGKTEFNYDEIKIRPYMEQDSTGVVNGFYVVWYEDVYDFHLRKYIPNFIIIECRNPNQYFTIKIYDKVIYNYMTYQENENMIFENNMSYTGNLPRFEYAKKILDEN